MATQKLKILLIGTQIAIGGAQRLLLELGEELNLQGHDVTAVFFYDRDNLYEKWFNTYSFPIYSLDAFNKKFNRVKNIPNVLKGIMKLWKILRGKRFDVAIAFTHDSNVLGLPIAWLAGVPVRIGTHLGEIRGMPFWQNKVHTFLINLRIIQSLAASSTRIKKDVISQGVNPSQVQVIPNAIKPFEVDKKNREKNRSEFEVLPDDILLISIGRLVYEKGHEFLIEAMSKIKPVNPHIKSYICGSGPLYDILNQKIKHYNLEDTVRLLGYVEDLTGLLASADVFVLPSRWEGLPIAVLEAMMAELPVISTRVSGVEEVIEDQIHGILIPVEDAQALSQAILQLTQYAEQMRTMGLTSRQQVLQHYSISAMARQYIELYFLIKKKE